MLVELRRWPPQRRLEAACIQRCRSKHIQFGRRICLSSYYLYATEYSFAVRSVFAFGHRCSLLCDEPTTTSRKFILRRKINLVGFFPARSSTAELQSCVSTYVPQCVSRSSVPQCVSTYAPNHRLPRERGNITVSVLRYLLTADSELLLFVRHAGDRSAPVKPSGSPAA